MNRGRLGVCAVYSNLYPQTQCALDGRHRGAHRDNEGTEFFHAGAGIWHNVIGMPEPRRRATDLSQLSLPAGVAAELASPREQSVHAHAVRINPAWWEAALGQYGLPGGPVIPDSNGEETLSRGSVFKLGGAVGDATSDETVLNFLWHVLAWGSRGRNNRRRLQSVAERMPEDADVLRRACVAARGNPGEGYEVLRPKGRNAIPWLGPAFLTKVLYFAGGGASGHRAFILDDRVAGALRDHHGWASLRTGGNWPTATYERYCDLLTRWASVAGTEVDREVAGDELELWLFRQGPNRR